MTKEGWAEWSDFFWFVSDLTISNSRAVAVVVLVLLINQRNNIATHKFMNRRTTKQSKTYSRVDNYPLWTGLLPETSATFRLEYEDDYEFNF